MRRVIGVDIHRTFAEVVFWGRTAALWLGRHDSAGLFDLLELGVQPLANDVPSDQPLALPGPPEDLGEGQDVMLSADGVSKRVRLGTSVRMSSRM